MTSLICSICHNPMQPHDREADDYAWGEVCVGCTRKAFPATTYLWNMWHRHLKRFKAVCVTGLLAIAVAVVWLL